MIKKRVRSALVRGVGRGRREGRERVGKIRMGEEGKDRIGKLN
jgi:hypothetical protein